MLTAESWQRLGHLNEAQRLVVDAQSEVDAMGSSLSAPEVLRLRGELLHAMEPDRRAEALARLREAAERAESQGATAVHERAIASAERLERADASHPTSGR